MSESTFEHIDDLADKGTDKSTDERVDEHLDEHLDGHLNDSEVDKDEDDLTEIDPNGNLILTLEDRKLRVSSHILSFASPVFKAMFDRNIPELHQSTFSSSRSLDLEDSYEAMFALCSILHHRYELLTRFALNCNEASYILVMSLIELTKVTKKYDCVKPVALWAGNILSGLVVNGLEGYTVEFLCAAYHLGLKKAFAEITTMLVYSLKADQIEALLLPTWSDPKERWFIGAEPTHLTSMLCPSCCCFCSC